MRDMPEFETYPFRIEPLPADEGGGFVIRFPDLPGCMSDGATCDEAIANGRDAFRAWMESSIADGQPVPKPNAAGEPVRFVQRLPRSLHAELAHAAAAEGVSMNMLVTTLIAEGLARREGRLGARKIETRTRSVEVSVVAEAVNARAKAPIRLLKKR